MPLTIVAINCQRIVSFRLPALRRADIQALSVAANNRAKNGGEGGIRIPLLCLCIKTSF